MLIRPLIAVSLAALILAQLGCAARQRSKSVGASQDTTMAQRLDITRASPEECRRRAQLMAEQDQSIRQDPNFPGAMRSTAPTGQRTWGEEVDPCPPPQSGQPGERDQLDERIISRTRARAALDSGDIPGARRALVGAYTESATADPALHALTQEVLAAWHPLLHAEHAASQSLVTREQQPVCTLSEEDIARSPDEISELFEGDGLLYVQCGLPPQSATQQERDAVLVLRRRVSAGRFEEVARKPLGTLASVLKQAPSAQGAFSLDESLTPQAYAYFDVVLLAVRPGYGPEELARGGGFWFATSRQP